MPVTITINGENAAESIKELAALAAGFNLSTDKVSEIPAQVDNPLPLVNIAPAQQPQQSYQSYSQAPGHEYQSQQAWGQMTGGQPLPQQPSVASVPVAAQAPVQQQQSVEVPTSTQQYDMHQLGVAATQLMDTGRQQELIQLLHSFGASSMMELPKEQYGAFATALRQMGAKI